MNFLTFGHPHIRATHAKTIEFTADPELTPQGDCILGIRADFSYEAVCALKQFKRLRVLMRIADLTDSFECDVNPEFDDAHEIVFRLGDFSSKRTLGIRASKAAKDIKRALVAQLQQGAQMDVHIEGIA